MLRAALAMLTVSVAAQQTTDASGKKYAVFDGVQSQATTGLLTGNLEHATLMGWFKPAADMTGTRCIMGRENLTVNLHASENNYQISARVGNLVLTAPVRIVPNRWRHVAVVFDAAAAQPVQLYVDGQREAGSVQPLSALMPTNFPLSLGCNPSAQNQFFKGGLDEIRIFDKALSAAQIQHMVYQEIEIVGNEIRGSVIPKAIDGLTANQMVGYFRMDANQSGLSPNLAWNAQPLHMDQVAMQPQSAPLPFTSHQNGTLEEAFGSACTNIQDIRNHDWAILHIQHEVTLTANQTTLGLLVDDGATLRLSNNNKIENTGYLKLDGKIDLEGRAQLVQTATSELVGDGIIERNQLAQSNKYNYNYWCSPVGSAGAGNNNPFTVNDVLRDGTQPQNPQPITWGDTMDGAPTSPITLAGFWIFKFQNLTPNYANWTTVGPYGTLLAGQGFTLKGSGAATPTQNLVFTGKPNNGTITSPVAAGNLNLTGNPYPSALDANAFIQANRQVTNGTIYIWEHFASNNTHLLADYQGGYATRNLVGGTPAVWNNTTSDAGSQSSKRVPQRFLPVGQGFFVQSRQAGLITFNNGQRAFVKEDSKASSNMFRASQQMAYDAQFDNRDDEVQPDEFIRIRLGFDTPDAHHRQVLLGFMNENASAAFESGYDAQNIDTQPSDMYLMNGPYKLVIAGEGFFNEDAVYPLGVKTGSTGLSRFMIDGVENLPDDQDIYIYDALTHSSRNIRHGAFEIELPTGTVLDRFSLRFRPEGLLATDGFTTRIGAPQIAFDRTQRVLSIAYPQDTAIQHITLYDLPGQKVADWPTTAQPGNLLKFPVQTLAAGAYIVQLQTTRGVISKKIIL